MQKTQRNTRLFYYVNSASKLRNYQKYPQKLRDLLKKNLGLVYFIWYLVNPLVQAV